MQVWGKAETILCFALIKFDSQQSAQYAIIPVTTGHSRAGAGTTAT